MDSHKNQFKGGLIMNMHIPMFVTSLFLFYAAVEGFYSDGMYTLLRIFVCAMSAVTAFKYYEKKQQAMTWLFLVIAVLFNPFIEIHFYRDTWEIIDAITGVIFAVVAYAALQEKKQMSKVHGVFDRMYPNLDRSKIPAELVPTIANLMAHDMETLAKGEIPERRLFLADAIKRDIVLLGYHKDFYALPKEVQDANKEDFKQHIYTINRLSPDKLDKILTLRKKSHNDLEDLEKEVRKESMFDKHVPPLFY